MKLTEFQARKAAKRAAILADFKQMRDDGTPATIIYTVLAGRYEYTPSYIQHIILDQQKNEDEKD